MILSISFCEFVMVVFRNKGAVYKAVRDVDIGPNSREVYLRANVKGLAQSPLVFFLFLVLFDFLCWMTMIEVFSFVFFR